MHAMRLSPPWQPLLLAGLGLLLVLAALTLPGEARAQQGGKEDEELLSGFDAELPGNTGENTGEEAGKDAGKDTDLEAGFADDPLLKGDGASPEEEAGPGWLSLSGFLRFSGSYNFAREAPSGPVSPANPDFTGWTKLRTALQLELSLRLGADWDAFVSGQAFHDAAYGAKGRDNFTPETLAAYEQEGEFREVYLRGTPARWLDVKLGRQIVVWGKSDTMRVNDVLNPLDFREPGLTDLEDLRLPLTMTRLDLFVGDWTLQTVAVHETRFNKNPVVGSEYYPYPTKAVEEVPGHGGEHTEVGAALSGVFSGWDAAFYWAQFYDDAPHVRQMLLGPVPTPVMAHSRLTLAGLALNATAGSWLLKGEAARFSGLEFYSFAGERTVKSRRDALLGLEYNGFSNTTLSAEALVQQIEDYDLAVETALSPADETYTQYVLLYNGSFLREQLKLVGMATLFGKAGRDGAMQRYGFTYELATALNLGGGVVIYDRGENRTSLIGSVSDNDRAYIDLKWDF